jgi:hypothetical protein
VGYKCSRGTSYTYDIWTKKSTCDEKEDKKENLFPPIANGSPSNSSVVKLDVSDSSIKPHGTYLTREKFYPLTIF